MAATKLHFETALLPAGWADGVTVTVADDGTVAAVEAGTEPSEGAAHHRGAALPGMPNLHSHAFQRAMAGLGEAAGPATETGESDSFWTWRQVMYGFLGRLDPDDVAAIALRLYVDMLKAGYTSVAEFHYLHHAPDGRPYDTLTELSDRVIGAALDAGIGITHLPVLYGYGGFGGTPAGDGQRRFLNDPDRFLRLVESLRDRHTGNDRVRIGIAPHSLRAVTAETLRTALDGLDRLDPGAPVHIHIAEQTREVEDCGAWSGRRPVEWLLDEIPVDARWCLVHATHITVDEMERIAGCKAVAGLCPTTEANLGDGVFPARDFMAAQGRFGIGSDSHISVSVKEELRWLEYGQRMTRRERNVLSGGPGRSTGRALYDAALAGGAQACARPIGAIEPGRRADIVVLDTSRAPLAGRMGDALLDTWLFACDGNPVRDVLVGGRAVVTDGIHPHEAEAEAAFRKTLDRLASDTA